MIAPEINTSVKTKLVSLGYTDVEITPLVGYSDSVAPFITFNEYVSVPSVEQYWLRRSTIMYYIYDDDATRGKNIGIAMDKFLNVGDNIETINSGITGTRNYRLRWCRLLSGNMFPAIERDGFISFVRAYEVGYIEL